MVESGKPWGLGSYGTRFAEEPWLLSFGPSSPRGEVTHFGQIYWFLNRSQKFEFSKGWLSLKNQNQKQKKALCGSNKMYFKVDFISSLQPLIHSQEPAGSCQIPLPSCLLRDPLPTVDSSSLISVFHISLDHDLPSCWHLHIPPCVLETWLSSDEFLKNGWNELRHNW